MPIAKFLKILERKILTNKLIKYFENKFVIFKILYILFFLGVILQLS